MTTEGGCALCGLPITHGARTLSTAAGCLSFCCIGCRQVYLILSEAGEGGDFTASPLFQECRSLGIIPATTKDLERLAAAESGLAGPLPEDAGEGVLPLALCVQGMWCPACAWVVQRTVSRMAGVTGAVCHFSSDHLSCRYDPRRSRPADIMAAIDRLGYRSSPAGEPAAKAAHRRSFIRFAVCALLTMNIMMLSAALYTGFAAELDADGIFKISLPVFFLATAVYGYGGSPIFTRAAAGVRAAAVGMETLVAIAATSAYVYSTVNLLRGSIHLYFDTGAMLITLVLLGQILEQRAKAAVQSDLGAFSALVPAKVRLCTADFPGGRYVPALRLAAGEVFRLTPGETAVADGVVIDGEGAVDESTLTGEPRPVGKGPGDRIISGTIAVSGDFRVRAMQVGADTTLMQMIRVMLGALAEKDPRQSHTDRWLLAFVPAIVILAGVAAAAALVMGLGAETALIRAVTVLVIACPCALGVAAPLARVAGVSMAAHQGILVRRFEAFERAGTITRVVLDKTGTVTTGRWRLLEIRPAAGHTADRVLAVAAALESASRHPIAEEIRRNALEQSLATPRATDLAIGAEGVRGRIDGRLAAIGSERFTAADAPHPSRRLEGTEAGGITSVVYLRVDGEPAGTLHFGDDLRPGMERIAAAFTARGLKPRLLSGDADDVTREVARRIGAAEAHGALTPEQKALRISALKAQGHGVAMIGDGINDAPALAAADLAVSVFSGGALDAEVADISLMRGHPGQLLDFLDIADRVRRNIRQNLTLSFAYNAAAIPIAMAGLLSPVVAVVAMLLSSLSVIGNTLRMMRRPPR